MAKEANCLRVLARLLQSVGGDADSSPMPTLQVRRPVFGTAGEAGSAVAQGESLLCWTPATPELSSVANAVSLSMPYVEPYVVASVRAVLDRLPNELAHQARTYCAQESAHHAQHRRFNNVLRVEVPEIRFVERFNAAVFTFLRTRSVSFNVAYAAGFETIAYAIARWFDPRIERFFAGASEAPAKLFLWHLAEEVEHKGVAFDVHKAIGGKRRTLAAASALSLVILAVSTIMGTVMGLLRSGRWWNPLSWCRLVIWSVSFLFVGLPLLAVSLTRDHQPSDLIDPVTLPWWLSRYDVGNGVFPHWTSLDTVG